MFLAGNHNGESDVVETKNQTIPISHIFYTTLVVKRELLYATVLGIGHIYCTGMIYRDVFW